MTERPLPTAHGPRKWRCDGCGRWAFWSDSHEWHGSMADEDDGNYAAMTVTCSDECRRTVVLSNAPHSRPYAHGYKRDRLENIRHGEPWS